MKTLKVTANEIAAIEVPVINNRKLVNIADRMAVTYRESTQNFERNLMAFKRQYNLTDEELQQIIGLVNNIVYVRTNI